MAWDEENRLMALSDNGKTSRYTYNAAGERIVKSHGDLEGVYVNGAPQGLTFHETEDYTIYPAPILSVTRQRFTKHYFIGDRRVASKIGAGIFQNAYGRGTNVVTAGQKDYQMHMMQIERQREDYYRKLGTPPGVPTMKGATAEPENTHEGYNSIIKELGDHSVPDGWIQRPNRNAVRVRFIPETRFQGGGTRATDGGCRTMRGLTDVDIEWEKWKGKVEADSGSSSGGGENPLP